MNDNIVVIEKLKKQLILKGLELIYSKVFGIMFEIPELADNVHVVKAHAISDEWKQTYIELIIAMKNTREGIL